MKAKWSYDANGNPSRIYFTNGNITKYVYSATVTMQKVIDWYFLIVSSVITIMSFCFCIQENNWSNILLFCFSTMVSILYIINILKTSAFFRLVVKCVSVLLSLIMALILPISLIILTFRYEIVFYFAIFFCILNIILSLYMNTEVHK